MKERDLRSSSFGLVPTNALVITNRASSCIVGHSETIVRWQRGRIGRLFVEVNLNAAAWLEAIFTKKLSTHNPTHSRRPLVRFSATYAAFGSPRSLVSCCKTCHGRGREFESRRPRHSFQKSWFDFAETNEGAKGHVFVPFLHPFSSIRAVFTTGLSS